MLGGGGDASELKGPCTTIRLLGKPQGPQTNHRPPSLSAVVFTDAVCLSAPLSIVLVRLLCAQHTTILSRCVWNCSRNRLSPRGHPFAPHTQNPQSCSRRHSCSHHMTPVPPPQIVNIRSRLSFYGSKSSGWGPLAVVPHGP